MNNIDKIMHYCLRPRIFYFFLACIITWPLWQDGYLFLFDWGIRSGDISLWNHSAIHMVIIMMGNIIGYPVFPKILCFSIVYTLGLAGHHITWHFLDATENVEQKKNVALIAGTFIILNPFVYARLIDGQWYVVMGMITMIIMMTYLILWHRSNDNKYMYYVIIWATVSVLISQHSIFFVGTIIVMFVGLSMVKSRSLIPVKWIVFFLMSVFILNANVIIGYVFDLSQNSTLISAFDEKDYRDFRPTDHGDASLLVNLLSMHGYWGERENRFTSTQDHAYVWMPIFIFLSSIAIVGVWYKRKDTLVQLFSILAIIAVVGAYGMQYPFNGLYAFLYEHIPYYDGLREPHKWLSMYVIIFILLCSSGLMYYASVFRSFGTKILLTCIFIMIFLYTPTMLFGFGYQMQPVSFPREWQESFNMIDCHSQKRNVIYLPSEQYIRVDFLNGKKITNPAFGFFNSCLNLQNDTIGKVILGLVDGSESCQIIQETIDNAGIEYIVISQSAGAHEIEIIRHNNCLHTIYNSDIIDVYAIR